MVVSGLKLNLTWKTKMMTLAHTDELKQLIEDAAKLLGLKTGHWVGQMLSYYNAGVLNQYFNPCNPERGDLMKVAEAAELRVDYSCEEVSTGDKNYAFEFTKGDYNSLALAVLRAASAVLKARGGV